MCCPNDRATHKEDTQMTVTKQAGPIETNVATHLYRDVHKGIRAELFAVTGQAGHIDPVSDREREELAVHVRAVVEMLEGHAEHEDKAIQPALEAHLPDLAARIEADHKLVSAREIGLIVLADSSVEAAKDYCAQAVHRLYLELAEFTAVYLAHQNVEERHVLPALECAMGPEAVEEIHRAIVSSIPPDQMARSLAVMLPAMNIDNRADMLGGMRAGAPPQIFEGVWGLANAVLDSADADALARRLGIC
jgi:hypothetical protein